MVEGEKKFVPEEKMVVAKAKTEGKETNFKPPERGEFNDEGSKSSKVISRRTFLKAAGAAAGAAGAAEVGRKIYNNAEVLKDSKIEKLTGIDFETIAAQNNFTADLVIPNEDGPYIVHIGQLHETEDFLAMEMYGDKVIETQQNIEGLIEGIQESNPEIKTFFSEGFTPESIENLEVLKELEKRLNDVKPDKDAWKIMNIINDSGSKLWPLSDQNIYSRRFHRMFKERAAELAEELDGIDLCLNEHDQDSFDRDKIVTEAITGTIGAIMNMSMYSNEYIDGAAVKMHMEDKITLKGTGTQIDNEKTMEAYKNLEKVRKTGSEDEIAEAEAAFKKEVYTDRENIAVDIISKSQELIKQRIVPLIYGDGHEFADNLKGKKIGLVELRPKKTRF